MEISLEKFYTKLSQLSKLGISAPRSKLAVQWLLIDSAAAIIRIDRNGGTSGEYRRKIFNLNRTKFLKGHSKAKSRAQA